MGISARLKERLRLGHDSDYVTLPVESSILSNIMVRSSDEAQLKQVLQTARHLDQLWTDEQNKDVLRVMVMVDATYPHLARMAELEPYSAEWISELAEATRITADGADEVAQTQDQLLEALRKIQDPEK